MLCVNCQHSWIGCGRDMAVITEDKEEDKKVKDEEISDLEVKRSNETYRVK